jgi:hypothetical protein
MWQRTFLMRHHVIFRQDKAVLGKLAVAAACGYPHCENGGPGILPQPRNFTPAS